MLSQDRRMSIRPTGEGGVEIDHVEVNYLHSIWPKP
jgi:hypothetical protein